MKRLMNWFGGAFAAPVEGKYLTHQNPTTEEEFCEVPDSGLLDIVRALQAAHKAAPNWQKLSWQSRRELLLKTAEVLLTHREALAHLESQETGAPLRESRSDITAAAEIFRYFSQNQPLQNSTFHETLRFSTTHPLGVVAVITPYCEPLTQIARKLAAALLIGNCVIVKPSETASATAFAFAELLQSIDWPSGVIGFVFGAGERAGEALLQHPSITAVSLTGRTLTGQKAIAQTQEQIKRLQLSLGARNPVLVFNDAEIEKIAPLIAKDCMRIHGSICLRGSRLFVQEQVYQPFLELLKKSLETLQIGDPLNEATDIGPLATRDMRNSYLQILQQTLGEKGKMLLQAPVLPARGFFVAPTLTYDLTLCSTLQQDEVFGPYISAASFKYQNDAIKHANNSPLARAAYLWTSSLSKAQKVAAKIEASSVYVNCTAVQAEPGDTVYSMKNSGLGGEGAQASLEFFSRRAQISFGY